MLLTYILISFFCLFLGLPPEIDAPLYLEWAPSNILSEDLASNDDSKSDMVVGKHEAKKAQLEQQADRHLQAEIDPGRVEVGCTISLVVHFGFFVLLFHDSVLIFFSSFYGVVLSLFWHQSKLIYKIRFNLLFHLRCMVFSLPQWYSFLTS